MDDFTIQEQVKVDEGYKLYVYPDSKGLLTVGWGHALLKNSMITKEIAALLFEMDWKRITHWYDCFVTKYQITLDPVRRGVIINMLFQIFFFVHQ